MMTAPYAELRDRLVDAAGEDMIEESPGLAVYGVSPRFRVRPQSAQQVASCLAAATAAGAVVAPWGGGSRQQIGGCPSRIDVALDLCRLNATVIWEPGDLTAGFESGATLAAVQSQLGKAGQRLAIEAPFAERATLGGLIATNTCGPRRWLHGCWRDQIIGMEMALANGALIKSGGQVVKNVQGYDLAKLFIGSLGTLGVITRVNVRIVPLAAVRRLLCIRGKRESVIEALDAIADSSARVSALDLLDARAARRCDLDAGSWIGLVLIEGGSALVDHESLQLARLATSHGLNSDSLEAEALEPVWNAWVNLARVDDLEPQEALLSLSCRPSEVGEALERLAVAAERREIAVRCWARCANGAVFVRALAPEESAVDALSGFQDELLERWPAVTATAGSAVLAASLRPWGREPESIAIMRAIKQQFDPSETLQRGRYLPGI
jgi:glycolate oxidase FAD binding subunit